MKTRRVFDVAVLGGSTAALVAACLLRREGYTVLHVEHDGLCGRYRHDERDLPVAPELLLLPRRGPILPEVLETLALTADAKRLLRPLPGLQILTPGRRFELPFESEARREELSREFGEAEGARAAEHLERLLADDEAVSAVLAEHPPLPPDGLLERRALRRLSAPAPAALAGGELPPVLRAALEALGRLGSYLHADPPSPLHRLRATAGFLRGVCRGGPGLGPGGYGRLLRSRFEALGGERPGGDVGVIERLGVSGGRVEALEILDDEREYRPRFVVSGLDVAALRRLLPLGARRRRFDARLGSVRPREILFTVNLVVRAGSLPAGLGDLAIYLAEDAEGALLLQRFEDAGGEDEEVLQVSTHVPAARRELGRPFFEEEAERVIARLRADLLPFLGETLVATSSPILEGADRRGARLNPLPRLETDLELALGVGLLPPSTPYKNLLLAGRENVPGLGLEGEFLAGHRAARIVAAHARRHDPLRR